MAGSRDPEAARGFPGDLFPFQIRIACSHPRGFDRRVSSVRKPNRAYGNSGSTNFYPNTDACATPGRYVYTCSHGHIRTHTNYYAGAYAHADYYSYANPSSYRYSASHVYIGSDLYACTEVDPIGWTGLSHN